jgi:peptidoglycan hydrolase-like protein with peptidoglycan-binding domain
VDGIFGVKTEAAVRGYQNVAGIGVDGIAGVHTWGHLLGVPQ